MAKYEEDKYECLCVPGYAGIHCTGELATYFMLNDLSSRFQCKLELCER